MNNLQQADITNVILVSLDTGKHDYSESLDELCELVKTANGNIVAIITQKRENPDPRTILGSGKIQEIKQLLEENEEVRTVIFDNELTPTQTKNLENALECFVIDRTMLILDIFAQRARSKEGKLQVETAHLKYILPHLIGKHQRLSRLAGGIGTRGPGETKLETDRRYIKQRIAKLEDDLKKLQDSRKSATERRKKDNRLIVAIVGYTNSGKSTLLNSLSDSSVVACDRLFETLDPTSRNVRLPHGGEVLFIDTVGFIRNLPHSIIDAFKSTLDEAINADLILNVCDISNNDYINQKEITISTLEEIGALAPQLTVFNKIDKLPKAADFLFNTVSTIAISAKEKQNLTPLLEKIEFELTKHLAKYRINIPFSNMSLISEILESGRAIRFVDKDNYREIELLLDKNSALYQKVEKFL